MSRHNHLTRDIKDWGKCPGCDDTRLNMASSRIDKMFKNITGHDAYGFDGWKVLCVVLPHLVDQAIQEAREHE